MIFTSAAVAALLALTSAPEQQTAPAVNQAPDATADAEVLPRGAPSDDYEFVAWCSGILSGHMELFTRVKPELDVISKRWNTLEQDERDYALQREAGLKAQAMFARAMRAAEAASPREITPSGQAAIASGVGMWKDINTVDKTNQAYSWLNWGLPARCEKIAASLEQRSTLAAAARRQPAGLAPATPVAPPLPRN
jgi:hypothetical protein